MVEIIPAELPSTDDERFAIYNRLSALLDIPPTLGAENVGGELRRSIERIVDEGEGIAPFVPVAIAADVDRRVAIRIKEESYTMPGVGVNTVAAVLFQRGVQCRPLSLDDRDGNLFRGHDFDQPEIHQFEQAVGSQL